MTNKNIGDLHALDNLRSIAGAVVAGIGQFVHLGRVYSHFSGTRAGSSGDQPVKRTKNRPLALKYGVLQGKDVA